MTYLAYFRIKHVIIVENVVLKRAVGVRNDKSLKAGKGERFELDARSCRKPYFGGQNTLSYTIQLLPDLRLSLE